MSNEPESGGLDDLSLFELFRFEAEEQVRVLQAELLKLEQEKATSATLESLMRAAHSIKGAARILGMDPIVGLTHAMEDRFVAAQAGIELVSDEIDRMLAATDWLAKLRVVAEAEIALWLEIHTPEIEKLIGTFQEHATERAPSPEKSASERSGSGAPSIPVMPQSAGAGDAEAVNGEDIFAARSASEPQTRERTVRIAADRFNEILSLASETLVMSRDLAGYGDLLERERRALVRTLQLIEEAAESSADQVAALKELERQTGKLASRISDLDLLSRTGELTAERLYRTVLAGRLRPFSEGITAVSRLVRDMSRDLGKSVRLEIAGEGTRVDRDILERLEAPISHLITNAIDHGIESPEARVGAGKAAEAQLRLRAGHENGKLVITVRDDGRGVDPDQVRRRILSRNLATAETANGLSDRELLEFLFLPGFSTREEVSTLSGRGVGLNVVQSMVQEAGGAVTVTSESGVGTAFRLTLPITRSVIKVIRVQVEGEIYALPLVRIDHVAHLEPRAGANPVDAGVEVEYDGRQYPVVPLGGLLGLSDHALPAGPLPLLLSHGVAFAVDRLIDEVEMPVRHLDRRLGKIPGVSAASLDETGLPVLILDMEDLVQTALGRADSVEDADEVAATAPHILIADDSHTVREMERRLLVRAGYRVTTAQNGQEAWNLLRLNNFDLLISDLDMPQMNGIELITKLRDNPRLGSMPVIILSYKEREEDRQRGLEAGADYYLTKGSFQNDGFRQAVVDLIGPATPSGEVGGDA
jgi:two-component system sensor histidine kinase and response regulator WspE